MKKGDILKKMQDTKVALENVIKDIGNLKDWTSLFQVFKWRHMYIQYTYMQSHKIYLRKSAFNRAYIFLCSISE